MVHRCSDRTADENVIITDPFSRGFPGTEKRFAGGRHHPVDCWESDGREKYDEISKMLKGAPNTTITVTVERMGRISFCYKNTDTPKKLPSNSVPYYGTLSNNLGYIRLGGFTDEAGQR
ncbi:MAG: hypothetical protein IPN36_06930 [Bacteroidetes bacterium]|nr:hypothetical protein [Bacteroidota bacterium]